MVPLLETQNLLIRWPNENATNLIIHDHHLVKGSRVTALDKLTSTEIYSILISRAQNKLSSNIYFENLYNDYNIDRTAIYMLPRLITCNTYMQSFQYKILKIVLFLNKKLHTFGIKLCVLFVIYTMKHLIIYFMNVIVLNVYGLI